MIGAQEWLAADILSLGMRADEIRREALGIAVTYLRVHTLTPAELAAGPTVPDVAAEVRLYETPQTLDEAVAAVTALTRAAGPRRVVAFSMADLESRSAAGWGEIGQVLRRLAAAGMVDVAELPVDRVPDLSRSMRVLLDAGLRPQRVTVSHPHPTTHTTRGEDAAASAKSKLLLIGRVGAVIRDHPSLIRFSPLPRVAPLDKPTTGYDDVRMVALSRLALADMTGPDGALSIEVDWALYGPKLAQVALTFGADHLDAVSAMSDPALGPRRGTVEDVERNIRAAGFEPQEYRPTR